MTTQQEKVVKLTRDLMDLTSKAHNRDGIDGADIVACLLGAAVSITRHNAGGDYAQAIEYCNNVMRAVAAEALTVRPR